MHSEPNVAQMSVLTLHYSTVQHSTFHKSFKLPSICAQFTHVGQKLCHGGTAAVCWTANATVHICNTHMDHTECTPSIQLPNTSCRLTFLQGDHHGNTNYNLQLAATTQTETSVHKQTQLPQLRLWLGSLYTIPNDQAELLYVTVCNTESYSTLLSNSMLYIILLESLPHLWLYIQQNYL